MVVIILCFFFVFGNCFVANSASEEVICEKNDTLIIETEMQEYQEVYELYFKSMNKCFLIFKLETQDGSSIEFGKKISDGKRKIDCFVIYNGSADGNQFLLFDYQSKIAYITDIIFANFYPIISSMDESKLQILLVNHERLLYISICLLSSLCLFVSFTLRQRMCEDILKFSRISSIYCSVNAPVNVYLSNFEVFTIKSTL